MATYYVLESTGEPPIVGGLDHAESGVGCDWLQGFQLNPHPDRLIVTIENTPSLLNDYFEVSDAPIVSKKFLSALGDAGVTNFDAYPVSVNVAGRVVEGYCALNVIGRIRALDTNKAKYVLDRDEDPDDLVIVRMKKLALDATKCHGLPMFRLDEYQDIIIIDEAVEKRIRSLSGTRLSSAEGWNDGRRF